MQKLGSSARVGLARIAIISLVFALGAASAAWSQDAAALKSQYDAARAAADWRLAETLARQLMTVEPKNWEYQRALADAQFGGGKYADAIESYASATSLAETLHSDAARRAVGQMLTAAGNGEIKLHHDDAAIVLFEKAARTDPSPATAYFNLCAIEYNGGRMDAAEASCDKAIQSDPQKADAYFIKGSIMVGNAAMLPGGKMSFPPGAEAALRKYLELAPDGGHAEDVKQMLDLMKPSASN
jgi:tetratricopeptide (TPR) repeat protein